MRILGRSQSLVVLALVGAIYTMVLCSGSASAAYTHKYLFSFAFSPLVGVDSIAVDDSTGDIYVIETKGVGSNETGSLHKFNSVGEPTNFTATGGSVIGISAGSYEYGCEVAVDNSSGPAKGDIYIATCAGGVVVYNQGGERIGELNERVKTEVPGAPWEETHGVAVDAEGHVYVSLYYHLVNKYTPTANPVKNIDYTSSLWRLLGVGDIAADSEGSVWVSEPGVARLSKYDAMQFSKFGSAATSTVKFSGGVVAVDPSNSDAYVLTGKSIDVYDSTVTFLERIEPLTEASGAFEAGAIAVNGANKDIYVSDSEHSRISVFGPRVLLPDATTDAPGLTTTTVTLNGTVNPDGVEAGCYFEYGTSTSYGQTVPCASVSAPGSGSSPVQVHAEVSGLEPGVFYHYRLVATNVNGSNPGADEMFALPVAPAVGSGRALNVAISTAEVEGSISAMGFETTFHVEYGTDTSYGSSVPVPDTAIGSSGTTVRQLLTGLAPGTTYHYRFVATNANGTTDGPDKTFTTFAVPFQPVADACPNAIYRIGLSANLPDCRAYEMVSPVDKNGANVQASGRGLFATSDSGERLMFWSGTGMADTHGSGPFGYSQYIASRTPTGWSTKGITATPALNAPLQAFDANTFVLDLSSDFSRAVTLGYDLPSVEGARPDSENLYLEDTNNAQLLAVITNASNEGEDRKLFFTENLPELGGSSSDMKVVSFASRVNYVPEAKGVVPKVYAFENGEVKLVGVLPDGSVPPGGSALARSEEPPASESAAKGAIMYRDTVSKDGSRIFFVSPASGSGRQLYMRREGSTSVLVSQSEGSVPTVAQNVHFEAATPDGTKVVFSTTSRLLDSDPGGAGAAVYLYTDGPKPESESNLTFIARPGTNWKGEGSLVKGISEDASRAYFGGEETIVTQDGRQIAFTSRAKGLTANEIVSFGGDIQEEADKAEIYVYSEDRGTLTCASCPQNGTAVTSGVQLEAHAEGGFDVIAGRHPRFFSNDGRYVFFSTSEALVAQDTNGVTDAYEYDTETGKLSLLSTGIGEDGTWFVQSSPDGRDVFLATRQKLSPWDPDKLVDVYDARVDGGLPGPPVAPVPCEGDECQGTPSAVPSFNTASGFEGLGNPVFAQSSKTATKSLGNSQRLKRALALCRKKPKRKRPGCEAVARKHYRVDRSSRRTRRTGR